MTRDQISIAYRAIALAVERFTFVEPVEVADVDRVAAEVRDALRYAGFLPDITTIGGIAEATRRPFVAAMEPGRKPFYYREFLPVRPR